MKFEMLRIFLLIVRRIVWITLFLIDFSSFLGWRLRSIKINDFLSRHVFFHISSMLFSLHYLNERFIQNYNAKISIVNWSKASSHVSQIQQSRDKSKARRDSRNLITKFVVSTHIIHQSSETSFWDREKYHVNEEENCDSQWRRHLCKFRRWVVKLELSRTTLICVIVSDFKHELKFNVSMQSFFDIFTFSTKTFTRQFLDIVDRLWQKTLSASSSSFHRYMNYLAQCDRLVRQYTQNIDWIENQLSSLFTIEKIRVDDLEQTVQRLQRKSSWSSTIHLHDRLDVMQCHKCDMFYSTIAKLFQDSISSCLTCQQLNECRLSEDK